MARAKSQQREPALIELQERRMARAAKVTAEVAAPPERAERYFHTTVHINGQQRRALGAEAARRQDDGSARRHDKSEVVRDVLDFWAAHREQFDEWMQSSRQRGGR
jgi:hypothetical protein